MTGVAATMRNFERFDRHLNALLHDIYAQPPDAGHTEWAKHAFETLCGIPKGTKTVLDVGCGQGFMAPLFAAEGIEWTGVTIGEDYEACKAKGLNVINSDMTFLPFEDRTFDMVFARHVLEHSPFPVVTLMEWRRVCGGYLVLIAPCPDYWKIRGRNHYSVLWEDQLEWLLLRSGWRPIHTYNFDTSHDLFKKHVLYQGKVDQVVEYRMLCESILPEVE